MSETKHRTPLVKNLVAAKKRDNQDPEQRTRHRKELAALVDDYLARGGQITVCENGPRVYAPNVNPTKPSGYDVLI
jgi:hypothetical protein